MLSPMSLWVEGETAAGQGLISGEAVEAMGAGPEGLAWVEEGESILNIRSPW